MNEILQIVKAEPDLQDVYNYLYKPMLILEDLEKKFKALAVKDKAREVNLDIPYKLDRIKNNYLPQIINTYCHFSIDYRNTKAIQTVNGQEQTAKEILLKQISKVLEEIELIEEMYYLNNQQQFLVNGVLVDRLGYENDLINNVEHVTLKNNFDYQTYHKQQEDKELKSKQVEEQEFENQKILNQAKKIQDEKDRKQKEQEEQLRLAKLEEETKIAEAKKLLEESEKKEEVIKLSDTIKNPEMQKSKNNKLAYLIFGSPVLTAGIAGVFFFTSSSNKLDQNTHQTAQNELQTISELYTSAINKEKIDPTQYISTKLNDQLSKNTSLETSKDDSTYNLTMGTGKSAEHISIKDSISPFDKNTPNELNKTHIEIKYQLPQIDGDSCFGLVKNLATTMQNINSITINNTEITKQDHTDHGVIINNDKVFQTCTDGTKELTINLGKID